MSYRSPGLIQTIIQGITHGFDKGELGEWAIEYILKKSLSGDIYTLRNLYIPYRDITTEIDLVMLHETGIYVFESKNYSGWIFGNEKQQYWTQSLKGGKKFKFYNPIHQNRTHINSLVELLRLSPDQRPKSYVVFSNRCTLKSVPPSTKDMVICNRYNMLEDIEWRMNLAPKVFNQQTLMIINTYLQQFERHQ